MEKLKRKINSKLKEKIVNFLKNEKNIKLAYIFGSYGTKYERKDSDLDLAFLFDKPPEMLEQLELAGRLELELRKYDIDLINLNKVNLAFKHEVVVKGEEIYSRDKIETANFKEYVFKYGPDAKIFKHKFQKDYIEGLKEEKNDH